MLAKSWVNQFGLSILGMNSDRLPNRVCILSNQNRVARRLRGYARCGSCAAISENTIHALRDCPLVIWNPRDWLDMSYSRDYDQGTSWNSIFAVGAWCLWSWHNKGIFYTESRCPSDMSAVVQNYVKEISQDHSNKAPCQRYEVYIYQVYPPPPPFQFCKSEC